MSSAATLAARSARVSDSALAAALVCWLAVVAAAMVGLWRYKTAPGPVSPSPARWPAESRLDRTEGRPALVMFVLPMCPCTRASLCQLNAVVPRFEGRVDAHVVFALPEGVVEEWRRGGSWDQAASIPGVRVHADPGEREARLFGAKTSGYVVLYDRGDRLSFSGGITASRGHEGDNPGADALAALLGGERAQLVSWPVFGCPLENPR